jgi:hypothetical protein
MERNIFFLGGAEPAFHLSSLGNVANDRSDGESLLGLHRAEVAVSQDRDHRFLDGIRHNRYLDFALPDVKHFIRRVALGEDHGAFIKGVDCLRIADRGASAGVTVYRWKQSDVAFVLVRATRSSAYGRVLELTIFPVLDRDNQGRGPVVWPMRL